VQYDSAQLSSLLSKWALDCAGWSVDHVEAAFFRLLSQVRAHSDSLDKTQLLQDMRVAFDQFSQTVQHHQ